MPYVSANYLTNPKAPMGLWVGAEPYHGQCVSFVKAVVPGLPATSAWKRGKLVRGDTGIASGTVIATFDKSLHYKGHAAIYVGQTAQGIDVVDQWITPPDPKPVHRRTIKFGGAGTVNNGDNFHVVE